MAEAGGGLQRREKRKTAARKAESVRKNDGFPRIMVYFNAGEGQCPMQLFDGRFQNKNGGRGPFPVNCFRLPRSRREGATLFMELEALKNP
jgi:hypothetical protein